MQHQGTVRFWKPVVIVVGLAAFGLGVLWAQDYLARERAFAERTACVGSLTRLRLAKALYAQEHDLTNGTVIPDEAVWRQNGILEHCHSGGTYSLNAAGADPTCSHTGAARWSGRLWKHALK